MNLSVTSQGLLYVVCCVQWSTVHMCCLYSVYSDNSTGVQFRVHRLLHQNQLRGDQSSAPGSQSGCSCAPVISDKRPQCVDTPEVTIIMLL